MSMLEGDPTVKTDQVTESEEWEDEEGADGSDGISTTDRLHDPEDACDYPMEDSEYLPD